MLTKTDVDITADVLAELSWDPSVTIADLDVSTWNGHVTLSGKAAAYRIKDAAIDAASRVYGVRGLSVNIDVDRTLLGVRSDSAIQADVHTGLTLDTLIPLQRVHATVNNGIVTLTGKLDYYYQRAAAVSDASQIAGVIAVSDHLTLAPSGQIAVDAAELITRAFARNAELSDDNVTVLVHGSKVTLDGTVRTWSERREASDAAWRASGVSEVVNNILVTS